MVKLSFNQSRASHRAERLVLQTPPKPAVLKAHLHFQIRDSAHSHSTQIYAKTCPERKLWRNAPNRQITCAMNWHGCSRGSRGGGGAKCGPRRVCWQCFLHMTARIKLSNLRKWLTWEGTHGKSLFFCDKVLIAFWFKVMWIKS